MTENKFEQFFSDYQNLIDIEKKREKDKPGELILLEKFRGYYELSHSDTIAYLLNPKEEHRHYTEYLASFLNIIYGDLFSQYDLSKVKIYREKRHIDILIEHDEFIVIIENKVDADDEDKQLYRYYEYVCNNYENINHDNIFAIYLTLYGSEPSENSLGIGEADCSDELSEELQAKVRLMSYSCHILEWLKTFTYKINETRLSSAIAQYSLNIEKITNQLQEDKDMKEDIKNILLENYEFTDEEYLNLSEAVMKARHLSFSKKLEKEIIKLNKNCNYLSEVHSWNGMFTGIVLHYINTNNYIMIGCDIRANAAVEYGLYVKYVDKNVTMNSDIIDFLLNSKQFEQNRPACPNKGGWYIKGKYGIANDEVIENIAEFCVELYNNIKVVDNGNGTFEITMK